MLKKIKSKLHSVLFPSKVKEISELREAFQNAALANKKLGGVVQQLQENMKKDEETPKPNMADLMRDSLKLITVDFIHQEKGVPKHFLDFPDTLDGRNKRKQFIGELAQIQQLEVWPVLMENLINTQGNYTIRLGLTDMEVFAGRMQISGISLVKDEVKNGYDEFMEKVGPKEEFDPTDHSTEGISYTSDEKDEGSSSL